MDDKLKIKVSIADRVYPLTIKREEEENIRKAAKEIEETIKAFEQNYAVRDKQDLLAMSALQFATKLVALDGKAVLEDFDVIEKLERLNNMVSGILDE